MRSAKILCIVLCLCLEVRVRASQSAMPVGPSACTGATCVSKIEGKAWHLGAKGKTISFFPGSLVEKQTTGWKLLKGVARVTDGRTLDTVLGRLKVESGEAWILDEGERHITVRVIRNPQVFVLPDGRILEIPEGHQVWIGGRDSQGHSVYGVPQPILLADQLKTAARQQGLSREQVRALAAELKELWAHRAEATADLHHAAASRYLASVEAERKAEQDRRDKIQRERDGFRRLLHRIVFEK